MGMGVKSSRNRSFIPFTFKYPTPPSIFEENTYKCQPTKKFHPLSGEYVMMN